MGFKYVFNRGAPHGWRPGRAAGALSTSLYLHGILLPYTSTPSMDSYPIPPRLPSRLLLSLWLEAFGRVLACATCIQHYLTLHGAYLGWDVRQARNALDRRKDRELLKFLSYAKLIGKSIQVPQDVASVHAALSIATPWSVIKVDYQYANVMGTFRPWLRSMSGDQLWR